MFAWTCLWLPVATVAQESDPPSPPTAAEPTAPAPPRQLSAPIQYVGPDTYILLDAEGHPQPMLGMSYDDFMAAWKQSRRLEADQSQPRYMLRSVQLHGQAHERYAELEVEIGIRLLSNEPVTVPLGMAGAILRSKPESTSSRGASSHPDQDANIGYVDDDAHRGFVARLQGNVGDERTIRLHMLVPLVQNGNETTLELGCPRALVASLSLDVHSPVVESGVSEGSVLTSQPLDGGTRLIVAGLPGRVRLSWRTAPAAPAELTTVLSATGAILVSIDGRSVRTNAHLTVRSYGGGFDRFRVRLPRDAKLIQDADAGVTAAPYQISLETEPASDAPTDGGQIVLVRLPAKQAGPVDIDLATEQPLGLEESGEVVDLAGFEVLNAVRQFGDVGLRVADDWQSQWKTTRNVRQVEPADLAAPLGQQPLTAAFQYDRQPWSLAVRVDARPLRLHVTPEYRLEWLPDEARLRVHLVYQVLGARAFEFRVALRGWELTADPVESAGLVQPDRVASTDDGQLVLPLVRAASRRAEVTFQLRRPIDAKQNRIELPLPTALANSVATGDLFVHAAEGIELSPDANRSAGLMPAPAGSTELADDAGGQPDFHFRCLAPEVTFVAERIVRSRAVSVEARTQIDVTATDAQVRQRFDYLVRYEPLRELVFDVADRWPPEAEAVLVTGERADSSEIPLNVLAIDEVAPPAPSAAGSQTRRVRVPLAQPRLGRFSVTLRYDAANPARASADGGWSIPLAHPSEGRVTGHLATVRARGQYSIELDSAAQSAWQPADGADGAARAGSRQFVATEPQLELPLAVQPVDVTAGSNTIIERAWLQTWLSAGVVQQRAALRFRTAAPVATVELPPEVLPDEVEVLLDGNVATLRSRQQGRLVVALPAMAADEGREQVDPQHTLELRYREPTAGGVVARWRWTPPQLAGRTAMSELYWHVVLPENLHLIRSPTQLAAADQWQWLGGFWGRRPVLAQSQLEEWASATSQLAPAGAVNQYLFSGLAPAATIEVVTAPRWLVVLVASGAMVLLAMAWMNLPVARRRWIVIAVAVGVAALAVAFPTPAMMLAEASVLGLVVAAITRMFAALLRRPLVSPRPASGSTLVRLSASRTDSIPVPPVGSATSVAPPRPVTDSQR